MSKVLSMKNIRKSFADNEVLKDISLEVEKGEVVAIIGPSGSGKSTFLRCATRLETIDSGEIYYGDECMARTDEKSGVIYADKAQMKRINKKFSLVFQNFNLFPHMSVMKNITSSPISVFGVPKAQAEKTAMSLLERMGLEDKAKAYPCELSGGQQQRVSIARALALNPEILFFDEPTSALDPELTGEILKVIRGLAKDKMTMVIVTHEMSFARDVADKIIFMDDGYVVEQGDAKALINNPKSDRLKAFLSRFEN